MTELPAGTVTFLFTDLEGSTRLWEEHPEAMQSALACHDEILRHKIAAHDGCIVKTTGDGVHAAFANATNAALAARDAQLALAAEAWEATGPLRVRMGIHTCQAEVRDGDYYGSAVNRAARLMSVANGAQVVLSLATEELAREGLPGDVSLLDLGEHRVRDLSHTERVFQLCAPGLPSDFAPLQSLDARARGSRGDDARGPRDGMPIGMIDYADFALGYVYIRSRVIRERWTRCAARRRLVSGRAVRVRSPSWRCSSRSRARRRRHSSRSTRRSGTHATRVTAA